MGILREQDASCPVWRRTRGWREEGKGGEQRSARRYPLRRVGVAVRVEEQRRMEQERRRIRWCRSELSFPSLSLSRRLSLARTAAQLGAERQCELKRQRKD